MKKNEALPVARKAYLKSLKKKKIQIVVIQIALLVLFVGLWQLLASTGVIDDFITSSPVRIVKTFFSLIKQDLLMHVGITLLECIIGFALSVGLGFLIAVGLWASDTARRVLEPYIVTLNSLPKIALGPIIIVWMGAGMNAIITMTVLICVIVTVISILGGFLACDEGKILLMRSMGANKLQIFFKTRPAEFRSQPHIRTEDKRRACLGRHYHGRIPRVRRRSRLSHHIRRSGVQTRPCNDLYRHPLHTRRRHVPRRRADRKTRFGKTLKL